MAHLDPRADHELPAVRLAVADQHVHQRALAGPVRTDQRDPLAEVDLLVKWLDQPVDRQPAHAQHDPGRVAASDPDRDLLIADRSRRRAGVAKPLPAGLHRVRALGPAVVVAGALLERLHQLIQPPLLLLPALDGVAEAALAVLPGLGVGRVGLAVDPGAVALERHDRVDRRRQHLAVVRDHQDRLARAADPSLERQLGGHVEEVVGLVEQQHVGVRAEQQFEDQLLALAAGQRPGWTVGQLGERHADDLTAARVPLSLQLIATERRVVRDHRPEPHPGIVVAGRERRLELDHRLARLPDCRRASDSSSSRTVRSPSPRPTSWGM